MRNYHITKFADDTIITVSGSHVDDLVENDTIIIDDFSYLCKRPINRYDNIFNGNTCD